jgi:hypothetical protein
MSVEDTRKWIWFVATHNLLENFEFCKLLFERGIINSLEENFEKVIHLSRIEYAEGLQALYRGKIR